MLDALGNEIPQVLLDIQQQKKVRYPLATLEGLKAVGMPCDIPDTVVTYWYASKKSAYAKEHGTPRRYRNYHCLKCQFATLFQHLMREHQWREEHLWPWPQPKVEDSEELSEEATYE